MTELKFTVTKCEDCTYWNPGMRMMGCQLKFNGICRKVGDIYYVHYPIEEYRKIRDAFRLGKRLEHYHSGGNG